MVTDELKVKQQARHKCLQPPIKFGGLTGDKDRMERCMDTISFIDNSVTVPEHVAFDLNLRKR